ncbi:MAG: 30S ribosomal protein S17e [Candidatus Bathyarchaeia archaeon]
MGSVRVDLIKRVAERLLEEHPESFSKDFEANKKALENFVDVGSKKLRNLIAGYITGLLSQRKEGQAEGETGTP